MTMTAPAITMGHAGGQVQHAACDPPARRGETNEECEIL